MSNKLKLEEAVKYSLMQLHDVLVNIDAQVYAEPDALILNASIGAHCRHILEMYECMYDGYQTGEICYDKRKRNASIETCPILASSVIESIIEQMNKPNKELWVESFYGDNIGEKIRSNYHRELHYNLEHTIHHMAIIRIKLSANVGMAVDEDFGVAFSTMAYKQSLKTAQLKN